VGGASVGSVNDKEQPHAIYRWRGPGDALLYIGRTNNPSRRTDQHRHSKPWVTEAIRIDLEWVPADAVREAERRAIQSEHPRYNVQHNSGRIRVEVSAEIPVSGNGMAVMVTGAAVALLAARWAADAVSTRMVRRRALRAGVTVELPPVRNPFLADPPSWPLMLLSSALAAPCPRPNGDADISVATYLAAMKAQRDLTQST
jgi:predicted GIY-YIG superfamily endonuclease